MKRFITLSLICLTLTSCSNYTNDKSDAGKNTESSTNTETTPPTNDTNTTNNENDSTKTENTENTENNNQTSTDAVTTPSITGDPAEFEKSLSAEGNWITAALNDITLDKDLNVDGEFRNKGDSSEDIFRKLALYTQDSDRKVTGTFTLTVPNMVVSSENFRIQEGVVKGNVTVKANGFELKNATIDGDLTFESDEFKQSAKLEEGTVNGKVN